MCTPIIWLICFCHGLESVSTTVESLLLTPVRTFPFQFLFYNHWENAQVSSFLGSPSRSSNNGPAVLAPFTHSIPSEQLAQNGSISTCEIANRRRVGLPDSNGAQVVSTPMMAPSHQVCRCLTCEWLNWMMLQYDFNFSIWLQVYINQTGGDMPALRQTLNNSSVPHAQSQVLQFAFAINQLICCFCLQGIWCKTCSLQYSMSMLT